MLRPIAFDIETVRWERAVPFIPEKGPKDRTDPWEKLKFDPNFNRIAVIGMFDGENSNSIAAVPDAAESTALSWFWNVVLDADPVITFNGLSFDIPFILRRSWLLGIQPTKKISLKRYDTNGNHVDVRAVLGNWDNYARGNLDLYSQLKFNDAAKPDGMDGSKVQEMWDAGQYDDIRSYCEGDCMATMRLYESLKGFYF